MDFVRLYWMTALGLLYSAYTLSVQEPILFYFESDHFNSLFFRRPWYTALYQSNDSFAAKIQNAILIDLRSRQLPPPELSKLMVDASQEEMWALLANQEGRL